MSTTFVSSREMTKSTAAVVRKVHESGLAFMTQHGQPTIALIPVLPGGVEEITDLIYSIKMGRVMESMRASARVSGLKLTMKEIDAEIAADRKEQRKKRKQGLI